MTATDQRLIEDYIPIEAISAEKADGFDPAWLRNAVPEPLEEADVRVEEQG